MYETSRVFFTPHGKIYYWLSHTDDELPWLVFLPGLSADHTLFDKQMEYFGGKFNCFVWDAPAHGLSRPFALEFTMEKLADYLHDIFKEEHIVRPVLIGQSMGGYISQVYMMRYPENVSGFVSIDSCSLSRKYYSRWELALLKRTKGMYMRIPWKLLVEWGITGTSTTEYGRNLMRQMWSGYEREEYCSLADHGFRIVAEAVEASPEYPIDCPVLLLCGKKDGAGSAKCYNRKWTNQDGHKLIWLKGAGHNANTDAPVMVNKLIEEFVSTQVKQN